MSLSGCKLWIRVFAFCSIASQSHNVALRLVHLASDIRSLLAVSILCQFLRALLRLVPPSNAQPHSIQFFRFRRCCRSSMQLLVNFSFGLIVAGCGRYKFCVASSVAIRSRRDNLGRRYEIAVKDAPPSTSTPRGLSLPLMGPHPLALSLRRLRTSTIIALRARLGTMM